VQKASGVAVGLALLGGAVWGSGYALGAPAPLQVATTRPVEALAASPAITAAPTTPTPRATPTATAAPVRAASLRTCSIAAAARDPRLHSFQGRVVDARTGEVLFDRGGSRASRTASVLKVLTSAAALHVLGPSYRLRTTVVRGAKPGQVVLVGGGDVTLSRTPRGSTTAYAGAPHLATLAARVKAAWAKDPATRGTAIREVVLDSSYFRGPSYHPSWGASERTEGYMPKITALMVDGDRADPYAKTSYRSTDPVQRAGTAFAHLLGSGVRTVRGTAPAGAPRLGRVWSQPVSTLVKQSLIVSDNTLAETLARVTAIVSGAGSTFAAEQAGTVGALRSYGISTTGIRIVDGSGLSPDNAVPPKYLTALFRKIRVRDGSLGVIYDGLPISGRTGSLGYADRFAGAAARADGAVHAKTGWIDDGYTLAGIIHAKDGTPLTFAFYALGAVTESTKYALDGLTADAWACGGNLANR
jgi:serine-type D-Ala-D-Ala carboxypeptidase/endopeptidase (penicillin-binding protein 4)